MANTLTLDDIFSSVDKTYANLEIPVPSGKAVLVNALQLPKDKRKALVDIQTNIDEGNDTADVLEGALRVAGSTTPKETEELIEALDGNLARLMHVFSQYTESTQAGEA